MNDRDEFAPLHCRRCHQRRLRAELGRNGLCTPCTNAAADDARQAAEADRVLAEGRLRRSLDTHMGVCPSCGSRSIAEFTTQSGGAGCILSFLVGGLLGVLFPNLIMGKIVAHHRRCQTCGSQWLV